MAQSSSKGTRKTYSFEEREILITLINKYEEAEDKKSDPTSMCKRKSAWAQLTEEYNSIVGPRAMRSAVQLRRCWENMKACKRNREERKSSWEKNNDLHNSSEAPANTGNVCLPPNVVFEPNASEPFTLQSVLTSAAAPKMNMKRDLECRDSGGGSSKQITVISDASESKPPNGPAGDSVERSTIDRESPSDDRHFDIEGPTAKKSLNCKPHTVQRVISPSDVQGRVRKVNRVSQREDELHALALSEARTKIDISEMLKQEARVKLEEAHYRKEEARLRMLFFTYKLERIKED